MTENRKTRENDSQKKTSNQSAMKKWAEVILFVLTIGLIGSLLYFFLLENSKSSNPLRGNLASITSSQVGLSIGDLSPSFTVKSLNGKVINSWEKKPKLLFFMATTCTTCKAEAPIIKKIQEVYGGKVKILTISIDTNDTQHDLEIWKEKRGGDWPHVLNDKLGMKFRVIQLSTIYILNQNNVITFKKVGKVNYSQLEDEVIKVINF